MRKWLRRLRGLAGFGFSGAIIGGLFGGVLALAANLLGISNLFGTVYSSVVFLALFGGASSIAVGMCIPILARSERVSDLSPIFSGSIGLLAGAGAPLVYAALVIGTVTHPGMGLVAGITGVLGGLLTGGMVAMAGQAERRELEAAPATSGTLTDNARGLHARSGGLD